MGRGKELDLSDIPASEEWMTVPLEWKPSGQRQAQSRKTGRSITWVEFTHADGRKIDLPDFALRREKGKNFECLIRIFNDLLKDAEGPATG